MTSIAKFCFVLAITATAAGHAVAGEAGDVIAAATTYFNAQNAHDIETVSRMMVNSEDFLLIRGPMVLWGHDPAVKQYEALYKGVWKMKTDGKPPKVVILNEGAAETFVPVTFTVGAKSGETKDFALNVTQFWVKQGSDWKIQSILATPVKTN